MKYRREKGSNRQNKLILVLSAIKKKKKSSRFCFYCLSDLLRLITGKVQNNL